MAAPNGIDWQEAQAAAADAGGYLATITSATENAFVFTLIDKPEFWSRGSTSGLWDGPWLGGVQLPGSAEPNAGWIWGELEAFAYAGWSAGQPNNAAQADRIHFGGLATGSGAGWADASSGSKLRGYVIEYSGATSPRTVGLKRRDADSFDGYTLFNPVRSKNTYLVDPRGRVVRTWTSQYFPGMVAYLLPNGNLLRAGHIGNTTFPNGGAGGIVEEFNWQGNRVWQFQHSGTGYNLHHDIERLPNGNILMIAWEMKTAQEAILAGREPLLVQSMLWPDKIIEVQPTASGGNIVWEWHAWDHVVQEYDSTKANFGPVRDYPELIDLNYPRDPGEDWLHSNSIAYNPKLDQIILSVLTFSEIWVIDHSTTTAQAASHSGGRSGKGGDLLYRWGNPAAYRAGTTNEQTLFSQHDAHWIPGSLPGGGHILIFNNGAARTGGNFSSVDEIVPPPVDANGNYWRGGVAWGPSKLAWSYVGSPPASFYSRFVSGAHRLPNGNTLVCSGARGNLFEVTAAGKTVWEYTNPHGPAVPARQGTVVRNNVVFRSSRYAPDYSGLKGRDLTPGDPIERYTSALLADGSTLSRSVKIGASVSFSIRTGEVPGAAGQHYQVATSMTPGATPVDYRFVRLGVDQLLFSSLTNSFPTVFQGYFGVLDGKGRGRATLLIPAIPALAGIDLYSAFLVIDPTSRSGIGEISNTVVVRVSGQ